MGLHSLQLPAGGPGGPKPPGGSWGPQTSQLLLPACSLWWGWLRLAGRNVDVSGHLFCSRERVYFRSTECLSF